MHGALIQGKKMHETEGRDYHNYATSVLVLTKVWVIHTLSRHRETTVVRQILEEFPREIKRTILLYFAFMLLLFYPVDNWMKNLLQL